MVIPDLGMALLSLFAISGIGRLLILPLPPLALHWYAVLATLSGLLLCSFAIQCLAIAGSTQSGFLLLGAIIILAGLAGHWFGRGRFETIPLPAARPFPVFMAGLLILILVLLLLICLAPSTKIDELHYHMLVGRRILEDQGLRLYQLPAVQAIVPQMGYQIAQTILHAAGAADAGNILGLAFGMLLWLLVYGVVTTETGSTELGMLAVLACAVGLYPAVWYVTSAPHSLGDLAMFSGLAAIYFPGSMARSGELKQQHIPVIVALLGAVCAASTKISLIPAGVIISILALLPLRGAVLIKMTASAAGLWFLMLGPLVLWAGINTGSPFGAAFAELFGQTAFQPFVLEDLENSRKINQHGFLFAFSYMTQVLNGCSLLLIFFGVLTCCRRWRRFAGLLFLLTLQIVLIAKLLPHDFRFLGGLQYVLLTTGLISIRERLRTTISMKWRLGLLCLLLGPWFAAELYYARPFVKVALGASSRQAFLERYVAFTDDFQTLDQILPRNAVLYVPNNRLPAYYAPRPVIFTLSDWDRQKPLYRFFIPEEAEFSDLSELDLKAEPGLNCGNAIYQNPQAVIAAFRTPGLEPIRGILVVQKCAAVPGSQ